MESDKYLLFNGDAYALAEKLYEEGITVNHIITDPPYNISQNNNFTTMRTPRLGVDFGEWDRGQFDLYSWIHLYSRLLDPNGSMVIFCSYRFISNLIDVLESEEAGMVVKDIIVWQKSNPMPRNIDRRYVQDMEFAIWAVKKNSKWVFNRPEGTTYLRAMYNTPLVSGKEKLGHPTQKSLQLMKNIVSVHTNPGETILDPFMGSGSTGEAALLLGRKFIGIEKDERYYTLSAIRLNKYNNESK